MLGSIAWARRGGAVVALGTIFLFGSVRQAILLWTGTPGELGLNLATLESLALLGVAIAALATLRSVHRTTKERDHAEDLHWDSMEAIRVMSELAGRPGAKLEDKLETVLDLGLSRFRMDAAGAWQIAPKSGSEKQGWLDLRASEPEHAETLRDRLGADLERAAKSEKPLYEVDDAGDDAYVFFGTTVRIGTRVQGAIGFAGTRPRKVRFSATENDLLTLMGQWLATELERGERARAPVPTPTPAPAPPARPRMPAPRTVRAGSLNAEIERALVRLQRLVGADGTLEVQLGDDVPSPHARRVAPAILLESLVAAAARVAPRARIEVSTGATANGAGQGQADATLRVTAHATDIDASAFGALFAAQSEGAEGVLATDGPLGLDRVERLLQRDGGDLSVSVEAGAQLSLTAYLPSAPRARATPSADRPLRSPEAQPSR